MKQRRLAQLISLALAFAPVQATLAADPSIHEEATAEDSHSLAAVSASRLAGNGTSLSGRLEDADRRGGMTVGAIELPGGARHAK